MPRKTLPAAYLAYIVSLTVQDSYFGTVTPIEGGGDLAVRHSLRDQRRHLGLPHGQRLQIDSGMLRP